jgi:hypothetical protein
VGRTREQYSLHSLGHMQALKKLKLLIICGDLELERVEMGRAVLENNVRVIAPALELLFEYQEVRDGLEFQCEE